MRLKASRRGWVLAAVLPITVAAYAPCANLLMAGRLLWAVRSLASGASGQDLPIKERKIRAQINGRTVEGLLYVPAAGSPTRAVIIVPGISELGCYHPNLMALSRFLANAGFLVLTPDVVAFREFRITAQPIEEVLLWYRQLRTLDEASQVRQLGLGGVSFSGTLALIAAARPEIRDSVGFVMGIGCYNDLHRLSQEWFRPAPPGASVQKDTYPTRFYAKWVMMLAARDLIVAEREREFLQRVLIALLLEKPAPPVPPDLSPQGRRWYGLAVAPQDQSDPELASEIEQYLTPSLLVQLDPRPVMAEIRCPVFLVHGDFDDLIPAEESRHLSQQVVRGKSHLLISPFLTHTHPWNKPLGWLQKTGASLDAFVFLYDLARVLR